MRRLRGVGGVETRVYPGLTPGGRRGVGGAAECSEVRSSAGEKYVCVYGDLRSKAGKAEIHCPREKKPQRKPCGKPLDGSYINLGSQVPLSKYEIHPPCTSAYRPLSGFLFCFLFLPFIR